MGELCRKVVSLFIVCMLTVSVATVLTGCRKKSGPEKIGEGVGQTVEEAGKSIEKGVDEAARK